MEWLRLNYYWRVVTLIGNSFRKVSKTKSWGFGNRFSVSNGYREANNVADALTNWGCNGHSNNVADALTTWGCNGHSFISQEFSSFPRHIKGLPKYG